jgi:nucleoside-diphosphate kinase
MTKTKKISTAKKIIKLPSFNERTLVLVKPDGVKRGLTGEIIMRFERAGLKVVGLKLVQPTREHLNMHYADNRDFLTILGEKAILGFKEFGMDIKKELGLTDKEKIGKKVKEWLLDYMLSGPVVAMVIQGGHAVENVRMICGPTNPLKATPGTIRGDYTTDSAALSNMAKRSIKNVVHASGTVDEAEAEITLWFAPEEIHQYLRAGEEIMF